MALDGGVFETFKKESQTGRWAHGWIKSTSRTKRSWYFCCGPGRRRLSCCYRPGPTVLEFTLPNMRRKTLRFRLCYACCCEKRLSGAKLVEVRQPGLERLLYLDFDAANELGDKVRLSLVIEIMGKYSNIILVDGQGKIVDALKRVDEEMSSQRLVQPGLAYELPPAQNKPCMLECQPEEIVEAIVHQPKNQSLNKGILNALQGLSPVVCREIEHQVGRGQELFTRDLTQEQRERLRFFLERLFTTVRDTAGEPYMVTKIKGKPMEFSFLNIVQYGTLASVSRWEDFSSLLDEFYEERDRQDRMRVKAQDLLRLLANASERLSRKINLQRGELARSEDREHLRVCGDLINANLYRIERGSAFADLENFYDENRLMRVKLDPALNATQNAQKYYKEYRKAKTAQQVLGEQIAQAEQELLYVDSVFDCLSRAQSESELNEIRQGTAGRRLPEGGAG